MRKRSINCRMVRNNLVRNQAVSLTLILFIAAASLLLSLAAMLAVNLYGAVNRLMLDAKTPHFMQMHSGDPRLPMLKTFAHNNGNVEDFQVLNFLNVDNARIFLGEQSLAGSLQDNGVCVQSLQFDFLLDFNNEPVHPANGELYVPVCYYKDGTANVGDPASINGKPFVVAGFVRDSQMNSTLASSKRFVVSEQDFSLLEPYGTVEYLIEFRLRDLSELGLFETAYNAAGLPANGPALTWPLFQMISSVSDGIMIAVLVLIAVLVILVSLLCVRFTLLAKIEDDYREIGIMRAIGMRTSDIRGIYLSIYGVIAAGGGLSGFLLSLLFQQTLRESIRLNLGESGHTSSALLSGAVGAALVIVILLIYVNHNLKRFRKFPAVQAIRYGAQPEGSLDTGAVRLCNNKLFSINFILGVKDVLARKRLYATMLAVTVLAGFIMIVPQNLYHTISGEDFVTYIGVGNCDLRIDIPQTGQIDEKTAMLDEYLKNDREIAGYAVFISKIFPVKRENGSFENLKVELGDPSVFPIQYAEGRMPVRQEEIALSAISAEELEKGIGEQLILITSSGEKPLTVCGIYSDITNGGKTAKAVLSDPPAQTAWSVICADVTEQGLLSGKISDYAKRFPFAKISDIGEYLSQTFGQTLSAVRTASLAAFFVSILVMMLVTLLFTKLLAAKDRSSIAALRALGYTGSDISRQYAWRMVLVLAAGIPAGTILARALGEKLSAAVISSFGAAAFEFTVNPLYTYLLSPLCLLITALLAVMWGSCHAGNVKLYESIKE